MDSENSILPLATRLPVKAEISPENRTKFEDIKSRFYKSLEGYRAKEEEMPNVFKYGREHFDNFDQIAIFVVDDEGLEKFKGVAAEIFHANKFISRQESRGLYVGGYDAVVIKRLKLADTNEESVPVLRMLDEAAIIHEISHASATNIIMRKIDPEINQGVEFKPMTTGLEFATTDKDEGGTDWQGTFMEEGFAQHHAGQFISEYYQDRQMSSLPPFIQKRLLTMNGKTQLVVHREVNSEDGSRYLPLPTDIDLLYSVKDKLFRLSPPSFAAVNFRLLCKMDPDFRTMATEGRKSTDALYDFWNYVSQKYADFYSKFLKGMYIDSFGGDLSFKRIAFDFFNASVEATSVPKTEILLVGND